MATMFPGPSGVLLLRVPCEGGEIAVRIETPEALTKEHISIVQRYLRLVEEDAPAERVPVQRGGLGDVARGGDLS